VIPLAILLLVTPLSALEITGPDKVDIKHPAWYCVSGNTEGLSVVWLPLLGADLHTGPPHIQDGHALFWAGSAGTRQLHAIAVDFDKRSVTMLTRVVVVGDGGPDPDPPPPPPPPPTPVPLKDLLVMILEERDQAMESGVEGAKLSFHIKEVIEYLKSLPKLRLMTLDDDQPKAKADGYVAFLAEKGLSARPVIVIRDVPNSRLVQAIPFGKDAAETIQRLKDAGVKQ
jgi:hypothetical protein